MQEVRTAKHWGLSGEKNGMFGKTGEQNPHWRGGCTPERQGLYCSEEWAKACVEVWKRDKATCQRCGASSQDTVFHIHHIVPFSIKELRTEPANLVLLCAECHWFVHSRENLAGEFIGG
jgi:hypothetical protein